MGKTIRIQSIVRSGSAFVRCGDIVKSLYADLDTDATEEQKRYIRAQIDVWENYEKGILKQAGVL